jgi:hypothetical protein
MTLVGVAVPRRLHRVSITAWTAVGITATGWLAFAAIESASGSCHGVRECSVRAPLLYVAFWLFFAAGLLLEGTELLIRWRRPAVGAASAERSGSSIGRKR